MRKFVLIFCALALASCKTARPIAEEESATKDIHGEGYRLFLESAGQGPQNKNFFIKICKHENFRNPNDLKNDAICRPLFVDPHHRQTPVYFEADALKKARDNVLTFVGEMEASADKRLERIRRIQGIAMYFPPFSVPLLLALEWQEGNIQEDLDLDTEEQGELLIRMKALQDSKANKNIGSGLGGFILQLEDHLKKVYGGHIIINPRIRVSEYGIDQWRG